MEDAPTGWVDPSGLASAVVLPGGLSGAVTWAGSKAIGAAETVPGPVGWVADGASDLISIGLAAEAANAALAQAQYGAYAQSNPLWVAAQQQAAQKAQQIQATAADAKAAAKAALAKEEARIGAKLLAQNAAANAHSSPTEKALGTKAGAPPAHLATAEEIAQQIANGHAGLPTADGGHLDDFADLGIYTPEDLADFLSDVLTGENTESKPGTGQRTIYYDPETGTIVVADPNHPDGGTAFRPEEGDPPTDPKTYYDKQ